MRHPFLFCAVPVDGHGGHRVDAGEHGRHGEEVVEAAVRLAEVPLSVCRVRQVDERIERGHGDVGESQVEQEAISDGPHPPVRQDDPDDHQVPHHGHRQHQAVGQRPERDSPRRLLKLVAEARRGVGSISPERHPSGRG